MLVKLICSRNINLESTSKFCNPCWNQKALAKKFQDYEEKKNWCTWQCHNSILITIIQYSSVSMSLAQLYSLSEQPYTVSDEPIKFPRNWRPPTRRGSTLSEANTIHNPTFSDCNSLMTCPLSSSSSSLESEPKSFRESEGVFDKEFLKDQKPDHASESNLSKSFNFPGPLKDSLSSDSKPFKSLTSADESLEKNPALSVLNPEKNSTISDFNLEKDSSPADSNAETKSTLADLTPVQNAPRSSSNSSRGGRRPTLSGGIARPPLRLERRTWKDITQAAVLQARLQKRRYYTVFCTVFNVMGLFFNVL